MEYSESLSNQYPPALASIYWTKEANQAIQLYQGLLEIIQGETVYKGRGSVFFEWLPSPNIKFIFLTKTNFYHQLTLDKACLKLLEIEVLLKVDILSLPTILYENLDISGCLSETVVLSSSVELFSVVFHLTNFHNFRGTHVSRRSSTSSNKAISISSDRLILEAEGWSISIDNVQDIEDVIKSLESKGGYAITHIGKIERSDKQSFTPKEAEEILEALHWFLSFCRGLRISLILLVGYSSNGEKIWEQWRDDQITSPWQRFDSWFTDLIDLQSVNEFFSGFLIKWRSTTWNDSIRLAVHWYLASNAQAGAVQGSIILMQAAFELLAGTLLVEDKKIITQRDFDNTKKYHTARKLECLLSECEISLNIPGTLTHLLQAAKDLHWSNGAKALTETRNALIHANPKKRKRLLDRSFYEKMDIVNLGLWYLELILLRIFGYKGKYLSRVARKEFKDQNIETVPWV